MQHVMLPSVHRRGGGGNGDTHHARSPCRNQYRARPFERCTGRDHIVDNHDPSRRTHRSRNKGGALQTLAAGAPGLHLNRRLVQQTTHGHTQAPAETPREQFGLVDASLTLALARCGYPCDDVNGRYRVEPLQNGVNEDTCIRAMVAVLEADDEVTCHATENESRPNCRACRLRFASQFVHTCVASASPACAASVAYSCEEH